MSQPQEQMLVERPIAVYDEFRNQLTQMSAQNKSLVFDYEDPAQNKAARSHIYKLRQTKSAVENARKAEKKASLEYGKRVDTEAKEIITRIESMIEIHAKPIEEIEAREKARIQEHTNMIESMQRTSEQSLDMNGEPLTAIDYQSALDYLLDLERDWEEFADQAELVRSQSIEQLRSKLEARKKYEAEQEELAQLRAQKEERERLDREEAAKREQAEREERIRQEATQRAKDEAERQRLELKRAAEAAELKAKQAEEDARRKIEAERLEEQRKAEKREANKRHCAKINNAAITALTDNGIMLDDAVDVIDLIAKGKIPAVVIQY